MVTFTPDPIAWASLRRAMAKPTNHEIHPQTGEPLADKERKHTVLTRLLTGTLENAQVPFERLGKLIYQLDQMRAGMSESDQATLDVFQANLRAALQNGTPLLIHIG